MPDGRTDGRTDAGNDNTRRPKLASGKNYLSARLVKSQSSNHYRTRQLYSQSHVNCLIKYWDNSTGNITLESCFSHFVNTKFLNNFFMGCLSNSCEKKEVTRWDKGLKMQPFIFGMTLAWYFQRRNLNGLIGPKMWPSLFCRTHDLGLIF